jgi:DNA-directed RNA polymerase subunit omega
VTRATLPLPRSAVPARRHPIAEFDVLRSKVDSTFHLVHLAAKRAREINGYYAHLGEGLTQYIPPLMAVDSDKPLSIALEEIAAEKIVAVEPSEDVIADPLSFIELEETGGTLSLVADLDAEDAGADEPA